MTGISKRLNNNYNRDDIYGIWGERRAGSGVNWGPSGGVVYISPLRSISSQWTYRRPWQRGRQLRPSLIVYIVEICMGLTSLRGTSCRQLD